MRASVLHPETLLLQQAVRDYVPLEVLGVLHVEQLHLGFPAHGRGLQHHAATLRYHQSSAVRGDALALKVLRVLEQVHVVHEVPARHRVQDPVALVRLVVDHREHVVRVAALALLSSLLPRRARCLQVALFAAPEALAGVHPLIVDVINDVLADVLRAELDLRRLGEVGQLLGLSEVVRSAEVQPRQH
ncbi:hypothetical protein Plhal304r1_c001g0004051 [Plasmopara halstedii]